MARISINDVERFKGEGGGAEFFSLKKDKEVAVVRFLYEDENDLDMYAVHEVEVDGKKRWVSCTDDGHCPLCKSGNRVQVKLFLQLIQDGERKTWERGKTFLPKILGLFDRYGPLVNREYEIERNGKPGDQKTTYELYPLDKDDYTLDEFLEESGAELQDFEDGFILQWSVEEMEDYLDEETFETRKREATPARGSRTSSTTRERTATSGRNQTNGRSSTRGAKDNDEEADPKPRRNTTSGRTANKGGKASNSEEKENVRKPVEREGNTSGGRTKRGKVEPPADDDGDDGGDETVF